MATTPNYGWVMPDPTDFVTDLPADFEIFGDAADASVKALNPGTTAGDIDYYTSSTAKARVGIGTAGQVLAVNGGATAPEWIDLPPSGSVTWTLRAGIDELVGNEIITYAGYSDGKWFIGAASGEIAYSTDAITWTNVDIGSAGSVTKVAWVSFVNLYIAILNNGNLYTSPDLVTWTSRTSGFSTTAINDFDENGSIIVFVGDGGTVRSSTNGTSTTARTGNMSTNDVQRVKWGAADSIFVAMTNQVGANSAAYSTNGTTWTAITTTGNNRDLNYTDGYFVAIADSHTGWSADGITWTWSGDIDLPPETTSNKRSIVPFATNQFLTSVSVAAANDFVIVDFSKIASGFPQPIFYSRSPIPRYLTDTPFNQVLLASNGTQILAVSKRGQIHSNF